LEISVKNIKVNYIDEGSGDVVLFLQGWGTNLDIYKKVIDKISKTNRIIALDFPGFGKTPEPNSAWDVNDYTDFTIEFIRKLKLDNITLIGHSFGGRVIIRLMNKKDKGFVVNKIVLVDSAGIKGKLTFKKKVKQKWYKTCKKVYQTKLVEKIFPDVVNRFKNNHGSADYRKASPLMKQVLVKTVNEDLTDMLPNIDVPTLLVWGDMDTATPLTDAKIMEEKIPDAGLVILKNTGHYSFLEDFYTFSRVIDSFLGGNK